MSLEPETPARGASEFSDDDVPRNAVATKETRRRGDKNADWIRVQRHAAAELRDRQPQRRIPQLPLRRGAREIPFSIPTQRFPIPSTRIPPTARPQRDRAAAAG